MIAETFCKLSLPVDMPSTAEHLQIACSLLRSHLGFYEHRYGCGLIVSIKNIVFLN